jgi:glycerol-3-phosphate dehydrogenase
MNSQTLSSRADLELAEAALREVLIADFGQDAAPDVMSLNRMLVHILNMQEAIATSPELANVAKRLGDFALTTTRMVGRNPEVASKLTRLSQLLGVASARLREPMGVAEGEASG